MGYEYIVTTEVKGVHEADVPIEVRKLLQRRHVVSINIVHVGDWIFDITCKNEEHGVTY